MRSGEITRECVCLIICLFFLPVANLQLWWWLQFHLQRDAIQKHQNGIQLSTLWFIKCKARLSRLSTTEGGGPPILFCSLPLPGWCQTANGKRKVGSSLLTCYAVRRGPVCRRRGSVKPRFINMSVWLHIGKQCVNRTLAIPLRTDR